MTNPVFSTIFLSWNRSAMLERTLESYFANTRLDHEVMLVDNSSDRGTREVIAAAQQAGQLDRVVLLRRNKGGQAFNRLLGELRGSFIHFSENDIEYWPGWDEAVIRKFEAFPELGQLSPFSPWPQDDDHVVEPAGIGSMNRLEAHGEVVYEVPSVGTTCIVRHEVIDAGVRWSNIDSGRFRFPNDAMFSESVKSLGYKVARCDRFLVKNWGHDVGEMIRDVEYYIENYANKSWVGVEGLDRRLAGLDYQLVCEDGKWSIKKKTTVHGSGHDNPSTSYSPPRSFSGDRARVARGLKRVLRRLKQRNGPPKTV